MDFRNLKGRLIDTLNKLRDQLHEMDMVSAGESSGSDVEQEEVISKFVVRGASMRRINLVRDKTYWERKFTKEDIIALKKEMGIQLSDEYEEKLERLDDFRPGEDLSLPTVVMAEKDEDCELLIRLSVYFINDNAARRFLYAIRTSVNDKQTISILKSYHEKKLCKDTSKDLWRVLHDAGLYKAGYTNWNAQLNKP